MHFCLIWYVEIIICLNKSKARLRQNLEYMCMCVYVWMLLCVYACAFLCVCVFVYVIEKADAAEHWCVAVLSILRFIFLVVS